jgi:hypothetical protein
LEELEAFAKDPTPDANEQLVSRHIAFATETSNSTEESRSGVLIL